MTCFDMPVTWAWRQTRTTGPGFGGGAVTEYLEAVAHPEDGEEVLVGRADAELADRAAIAHDPGQGPVVGQAVDRRAAHAVVAHAAVGLETPQPVQAALAGHQRGGAVAAERHRRAEAQGQALADLAAIVHGELG